MRVIVLELSAGSPFNSKLPVLRVMILVAVSEDVTTVEFDAMVGNYFVRDCSCIWIERFEDEQVGRGREWKFEHRKSRRG